MTKINSVRRAFGLWCAFLAAGVWILPVKVVAAPMPISAAYDGGEGAVALESASSIAVESVAEVALFPKAWSPCDLTPGVEVFLLLSSQPIPEECLAELGLATPGGTAPAIDPVEVRIGLHSVAVAIVREGESSVRFGFGLRSDVLITAHSPDPGAFVRAESFRLVSEAACASEAVDGAMLLWNQITQAAPPPAQVPYYSTCVQACLTAAHNQWWKTVMDCINVSGTAAALVSGAAVLACLLTGPGWIACVTALLTGIGIGTAMVWSSCLASYFAAMAVAIPACTVGCAW